MKKIIIMISAVVTMLTIETSCRTRTDDTETFTTADSVYVEQSIAQRITVYGDIHALASEDDAPEDVKKTQIWLRKTVTEKIIIAEGISEGDTANTRLMITKTREGSPETTDEAVINGLKIMDRENISYLASFVLKSKKLIFGGENDSLYRATSKTNSDNYSSAKINARSRAIFLSAIKIAKIYPTEKIAIIIGRRHLTWFSRNGIKTVDPKK